MVLRYAPPDKVYINPDCGFGWSPRNMAVGKLHAMVVEDAPWLFVVHDLNPRALSPKVKGFVQPQSWFVDLTLPWVEQ